MLLDVVFVLGLEFYKGIVDNLIVVVLETIAAVFLLEGRDYVSHILVFSEKALVLAAALHGAPAFDEDCHLLEDFVGST
jgi:hypothetical protein